MKVKYIAEFPEEFHYYIGGELVMVFYSKEEIDKDIKNMVGEMIENEEGNVNILDFLNRTKVYEIGKEINMSYGLTVHFNGIEAWQETKKMLQ